MIDCEFDTLILSLVLIWIFYVFNFILQLSIFIIFLTESTFKSQWCPWELGYADALNKKIYVYISPNLKNVDIPIFYRGYTEIKSVDEIIIENN